VSEAQLFYMLGRGEIPPNTQSVLKVRAISNCSRRLKAAQPRVAQVRRTIETDRIRALTV
jgi:hypothetical protein